MEWEKIFSNHITDKESISKKIRSSYYSGTIKIWSTGSPQEEGLLALLTDKLIEVEARDL